MITSLSFFLNNDLSSISGSFGHFKWTSCQGPDGLSLSVLLMTSAPLQLHLEVISLTQSISYCLCLWLFCWLGFSFIAPLTKPSVPFSTRYQVDGLLRTAKERLVSVAKEKPNSCGIFYAMQKKRKKKINKRGGSATCWIKSLCFEMKSSGFQCGCHEP